MAKKKQKELHESKERSAPKFPYTNAPADLKKLLELIPDKPKPPKLISSTAKTWGIKNNNVSTAIGVLREIGLIDGSGVPTEEYAAYMNSSTGGSALGANVKSRYKQLFGLQKEPQNATHQELKNFFNIHSGGAESTIDYQIKTFKALAEFSNFDGSYEPTIVSNSPQNANRSTTKSTNTNIHFDLHIHLPENKTASDYDAIIKALSDQIIQKLRD